MGTIVLKGDKLDKSATAEVAQMGHNNPPEPTPLEAARETISMLDVEAANWFDGEPILNQAQADEVARLIDAARKAKTRFDNDRKAEKQPHDQAAKAVDAAWKPVIADADRIVEIGKSAQTTWLIAQDKIRRETEAAMQREAEAKAEEARKLAEAADGSLAAAKARDAAIADAKTAADHAAAAAAEKSTAKGAGMARAISLRTTYRAEVQDRRALLNYIAKTHPADLSEWLDVWAAKAVRGGLHDLPGVHVWEERAAA